MLIAMAFHTLDLRRVDINAKVLRSLHTQLRPQDRLVLIDNASCAQSRALLHAWADMGGMTQASLIENKENVGTAEAINMAWADRKPLEVCLKMDDDCIVDHPDWIGLLEDAIRRDKSIGICGLKRRDLTESPLIAQQQFHTTLEMLPHRPGERWIVVEQVSTVKGYEGHVFGTCQAYNPALLDVIGGLYQMQDEGNVYGYDDSLASLRAIKAGFRCCFLCGVDIKHLDPGGDEYTEWKRKQAGIWQDRVREVAKEIRNGTRNVYYPIKQREHAGHVADADRDQDNRPAH